MSRRMQINPTARRGAARRNCSPTLERCCGNPFSGMLCCTLRRWGKRQSASDARRRPSSLPARSPRKCPPRVRHCNGAHRCNETDIAAERALSQRVRRDPEYRVPSSLRDPPRGVTHPGATRTRLCSPTRVRSLTDRPTIVISPLSPLSLSLSLSMCVRRIW